MRRPLIVAWALWSTVTLNLGASPQDPPQKSSQAKPASQEKAGEPHAMTGCLQKGTEPKTFVLQNTEPTGPKVISIVESKTDLQGYLGLKIEITGLPVAEKEVAAMKPKPSKADHYMRVTAAKLITTACP
jgi:hypothetical protein